MTHSNFRLKEGFTCEGFHSQQKGAMSGKFREGSPKLSSHQNEASRTNEVLQIPTSSDPKY